MAISPNCRNGPKPSTGCWIPTWASSHKPVHPHRARALPEAVARHIIANYWGELEGQALPILVLSGRDLDGHTATVLANSEGNATVIWITACNHQPRGPVCTYRWDRSS